MVNYFVQAERGGPADVAAGDRQISQRVVTSGATYADFDCAEFTDGGLLSCSAQGAFVFENCER